MTMPAKSSAAHSAIASHVSMLALPEGVSEVIASVPFTLRTICPGSARYSGIRHGSSMYRAVRHGARQAPATTGNDRELHQSVLTG